MYQLISKWMNWSTAKRNRTGIFSRGLGRTKTDLNRSTVLESTMDNFLLQCLIDQTGADVAFSNGWRYGAPVLAGPVTLNDLYNITPMNPPLSVVTLTCREIWQMMEENLERTISCDSYHQMGGYVKRCLGLNVYFKIENPAGARIQELFVHGTPCNRIGNTALRLSPLGAFL